MRNKFKQTAQTLTHRLRQIDFDRLSISDYNKQYIRRLKPALSYYMNIYAVCLQNVLQASGLSAIESILIDYGGGSGFLSMLAKQVGFKQVLYIDLNPASVKTITLLKEQTGIGPDIILQGDSGTLATWCNVHHCQPQLLVATDLIEHVYNLSVFFADLLSINNRMQMLFTTASTPFNPYVKRKLHRLMTVCEKEYEAVRRQYIQTHFPTLSATEIADAARKTRGLVFPDIQQAIALGTYPALSDPFNTCDPQNGNWAERILPIQTYQAIVEKYDYQVSTEKGFYNTERSNPLFRLICRCLNSLIRLTGKAGFMLAPFIILSFRKK